MMKLETAVMAIIITIGALTIPAFTAASPTTKAPTIEIAVPIGFGSLVPDSRKSSMKNSIKKASTAVGNGTLSRLDTKVTKNIVGIISWLKVNNATKKPGSMMLIIKAITRITLSREVIKKRL